MSVNETIPDLKNPPANGDIFAVRVVDNWDGEGDKLIRLAYIDNNGVWREVDSNSRLIHYEGDRILEWWPLVPMTGINTCDPAK